jgi:hypothetical protein
LQPPILNIRLSSIPLLPSSISWQAGVSKLDCLF